MSERLESWSFRCPTCGTWGSTLASDINGARHEQLDERLRATGLSVLRARNNAEILSRLQLLGVPVGARLLDVGSAHGWFVRAALDAGYVAEGIEPDAAVALAASDVRDHVRIGLFPDALSAGDEFDVISFNDVLEHIVDVRATLEAVREHLKPRGWCSVNIPNRRGAVYRAAVVAHGVGIDTVFDRLWQKDLPSPHVWYFDESALISLASSVGLECVFTGRLNSVDRHGLWERAHADRPPSPATVTSVAVGWLAAPLLNSRRASDIMHLVFRRTER